MRGADREVVELNAVFRLQVLAFWRIQAKNRRRAEQPSARLDSVFWRRDLADSSQTVPGESVRTGEALMSVRAILI